MNCKIVYANEPTAREKQSINNLLGMAMTAALHDVARKVDGKAGAALVANPKRVKCPHCTGRRCDWYGTGVCLGGVK